MFKKQERHMLAQGSDQAQLFGAVTGALGHQGLPMVEAYNQLSGIGPNAGNGVKPKVTLALYPSGNGQFVDISVSAEFDTNSIIIFAVLVVVFWPVALILGYLAYQTFERRAVELLHAVRAGASAQLSGPVMGGAFPPPGGVNF